MEYFLRSIHVTIVRNGKYLPENHILEHYILVINLIFFHIELGFVRVNIRHEKMNSYCLKCRKHTSGSFVRHGKTSKGKGYSIFKCNRCGTNKSVFNKGKSQKGGIVGTYFDAEPLPNNGYKGLGPILAAYSAANKVKRLQKGNGFDIQKWIAKSGMEFHPPGYQFLGPGTHLEYHLAKGQQGINRLDKIARKTRHSLC